MSNADGPPKSFSSAVNDDEDRVLPVNVDTHGVWPARSVVTSMPYSVKPLRSIVSTVFPVLSRFGHGPPLMAVPLLKAQIVSAGLQPSPVVSPTGTYSVPFHARTWRAPIVPPTW